MLDRVREALFSTVQDWTADARVLDLFAGSGSLGLEALSRGAERARFVERSAAALSVLRRNVQTLGVADRVEIVRGNALQPATWHDSGAAEGARFDIVFFDPPYAMLEDAAQFWAPAVLAANSMTKIVTTDSRAMATRNVCPVSFICI